MVKIVILNDDRCMTEKFSNVHGFSAYINVDEEGYLFDVGQEDCFSSNAKKLKIDLTKLNCVIFSHGHYDHTKAIRHLPLHTKIICHPEILVWRRSKKTGKYNGFPLTKEEFETDFDVTYSKDAKRLSPNLWYLGEIERRFDFECKNFPSTLKNGEDDKAIDDTALAITTNKGLVVIVACSHSGVCNILEHAKKVTGENRVYAVIGGFHLKTIDEQTQKTLNYFKQSNITNVYLGHCTSDEVCNYFVANAGAGMNCSVLQTGQIIEF